MSIYCSYFGMGDEHKPKCARIKKVSGWYEQDDSKPCTCGSCPIKYQGSHVLPSRQDERDGYLGFAMIATHITKNGRDNREREHPYLRFHLNRASVVVTRKQATQLRDALTEWLSRGAR